MCVRGGGTGGRARDKRKRTGGEEEREGEVKRERKRGRERWRGRGRKGGRGGRKTAS